MKQLVDVIIMVAEKYIKDMEGLIHSDSITLQIFKNNNKTKIYKTLEISEQEGKLKVVIVPENITKITDLSGLEDLIIAIRKQKDMQQISKEEIKEIKEKYIVGTKVELIKMYDYINAVPEGTKGIIEYIDDIGTLHIKWENGSGLGLVVGVDEFKIIK